jgi:hypothetical protein
MKNHPVLKKVDISELMDTMMELWRRGIDYIDILIKPEENSIALLFTEEYLSDEAREKLEEMEDDDEGFIEKYREIKGGLTDEDLNQLM